MTTPIALRLADPSDAPLIARLRLQFQVELGGELPEAELEVLRQEVQAYLERETGRGCITVLAYSGEEVAGMGSMVLRTQPGSFKNPKGLWGYVMNMFTLPDHRRKGVCKAVLDALVAEGEARGCRCFELHATEMGQPIYEREGFQPHIEPTLRKYT